MNPTTNSDDAQSDPFLSRYGRRTRIGLLVLLAVTALFAGGALLVKYKLEGLRASVEKEVESRTGARLHVGSVLVNGLRGLRIDDVDVTLESAAGPRFEFQAPVTYIYIDVVDLLHGQVTIDRIQADQSVLRFSRPADRPWIAADVLDVEGPSRLLEAPSFRVTGSDCTLEVLNVVGDTRLQVNGFGFDIARLGGSPDITAKLSGTLATNPGNRLDVDLRFTSVEDFDLRLQASEVTSDDVAVFLPASERLVRSGVAVPSIRVAGYPGMTFIVAFEAPFENVAVRNQPAFILPAAGTLRGVASYDSVEHVLSLTAAKVESTQLCGRVEGSVDFNGAVPALDLRFEATDLPLKDALDYSLAGRGEEYGAFDLELQEPCNLQVRLKGTTEAPLVSVHGKAEGGRFAFAPKDETYPGGELRLGMMSLIWNSKSGEPVGVFNVVDGSMSHPKLAVKAEKISGTLALTKDTVRVAPLNAEIRGNPFVGMIKYDIPSGAWEVTANGTVADIENTMLARPSKDWSLAGSARVRGHLVKTATQYVLDAEVDATQAEIAYQWWFLKPPGIGAASRKIHMNVIPNRSITLTGRASVASSDLDVSGYWVRKGGRYRLDSFEMTSNHLDVTAAGACLSIPYKVTGGTATEGSLTRTQDTDVEDAWQLAATLAVDEVAVLPEGGETPMQCEGLRMEMTMTGPPALEGSMKLTAENAHMPPIGTGSVWFVPIKSDPMVLEAYPDQGRSWHYTLAADALELSPWKGAHFTGTAYQNADEAGLDAFTCELEGGGHVEGAYRSMRADNTYTMAFEWRDMPIVYLIDQLDYPHVFTGPSNGHVDYSMDRDDPGTLKGHGAFEIREGQFSADFLMSQLAGRLEEHITAIPLSLEFDHLKTDVSFERDLIRTPNMELVSEGITVTGGGTFVTDGDMDYDLKVALSPEVAEQIPVLRDNLNVQGHRLAQQKIELAFKVKGPTFNPQGELSEPPPIGITMVSSALEVTSEAMRVIDIPRKILVDLLRIGGGLVGMPRATSSEER